MDNWKYHKTKVASYWLVKLDAVKQRKVSDINIILLKVILDSEHARVIASHLVNRVGSSKMSIYEQVHILVLMPPLYM